MKNYFTYLFPVLAVIALITGCSERTTPEQTDRDLLFNADWKFIRASIPGAEQVDIDDSDWMTVDLPHDYSLMDLSREDAPDQIGPFSKKSPGNGNATGHFIGGTGWYRKRFTLEKADEGKTAILEFDGIYMESELWVNGEIIGIHKNGYTPFWFDITSFLNKAGEPNIIAVKVDNQGRNSRWYSGSGIYRNVHLTLTGPVYVNPRGVYVTTPEITSKSATASVEISVQNGLDKEISAQVTINIKDANANLAGTSIEQILVSGKKDGSVNAIIEIADPDLWSLETPTLYTAEIILETDNKIMDRYVQFFGIRSIVFSSDQGFLLNGESVLLKGACIHHDHGLLGAASFARAEERKVEILKANGFNAIRCAHNPYSQAFYEACDRLGMLVIDEFTDMWVNYKNPQDYSLFFKEWWEKDLRNWMMSNRNHPSIIMWSIGNEIYEPDASKRLRIGKELAEAVRDFDQTRALTMGVTGFFYPNGWESTAPIFDLMDVCGYNYMLNEIESDHQKYPDRIIYTSESYTKSAYNYWKTVEKHPFVIGDFIWTAWDYLGEVSIGYSSYVPESQVMGFSGNFSNFTLPEGVNIFDIQAGRPSNWPNYLANCGDIDITGEKTPQVLYRDVIWGNSNLEINVHEPIPEGMAEFGAAWAWPIEFPHWNWQGRENELLQVRVFTRASEVRLELNGKVVGEKELRVDDQYIAGFKVPYKSGELTAVCMENGVELERKILKTTGPPAAIRLTAEQTEIKADRNELAFVKIEVVDEIGQVVPQDSIRIKLSIEGRGELIASGNASTKDMESFNKTIIKNYQGKAQAIIRPFSTEGEIEFIAESEGLKAGRLVLTTK